MAAKSKSKRYEEKLNTSLDDPAINPAMMFVSGNTAEPPTPQRKPKEPPAALLAAAPPENAPLLKPMRRELRNRRANLLFPPSLFDKLAAAANNSGVSVNEYVIFIVENALKRENC
jgi:hypothetical protein